MSRDAIARRVRLVIARELACPISRLDERADFRADLKADSLDMVGIPAALEEEFGIQISDDQAAFCETVGTAIDLIETKLENGRGR